MQGGASDRGPQIHLRRHNLCPCGGWRAFNAGTERTSVREYRRAATTQQMGARSIFER